MQDVKSLKKLAEFIEIIIQNNPIEQVMDEAHVFAAKFHLKSREDKILLDNTLKNINFFLKESYKNGLQLVELINKLFLRVSKKLLNKKNV